jgi:hypothetical protein
MEVNRAIDSIADMKPRGVIALANAVAWTPCQHFKQCVGLCPVCWALYLFRPEPSK